MKYAHIALAVAVLSAACAAGAEKHWLDETEIDLMSCGWGKPAARKSIGGNALRVGGEEFARGVGTHAPSVYKVALGGAALSFEAKVGVDDETNGKGAVAFRIYADGRLVAEAYPKGSIPHRHSCMPTNLRIYRSRTSPWRIQTFNKAP